MKQDNSWSSQVTTFILTDPFPCPVPTIEANLCFFPPDVSLWIFPWGLSPLSASSVGSSASRVACVWGEGCPGEPAGCDLAS